MGAWIYYSKNAHCPMPPLPVNPVIFAVFQCYNNHVTMTTKTNSFHTHPVEPWAGPHRRRVRVRCAFRLRKDIRGDLDERRRHIKFVLRSTVYSFPATLCQRTTMPVDVTIVLSAIHWSSDRRLVGSVSHRHSRQLFMPSSSLSRKSSDPSNAKPYRVSQSSGIRLRVRS